MNNKDIIPFRLRSAEKAT